MGVGGWTVAWGWGSDGSGARSEWPWPEEGSSGSTAQRATDCGIDVLVAICVPNFWAAPALSMVARECCAAKPSPSCYPTSCSRLRGGCRNDCCCCGTFHTRRNRSCSVGCCGTFLLGLRCWFPPSDQGGHWLGARCRNLLGWDAVRVGGPGEEQRLGSNASRLYEGVTPSTESLVDFIGGLW